MRDLTGERFGKLTVVSYLGMVKYGGRRQAEYRCACDCGQVIDLPAMKLPGSDADIRSAERAGRRIYDCCEECRKKTCPICGERFSYSHVSFICPKRECKAERMRIRDQFWHEVASERYRTDPEYREQVRIYQAEYWSEHRDELIARAKNRLESLPDRELMSRKSRQQSRNARHYAIVRADPEKWANWVEYSREWRNKKALQDFLADVQTITDRGNKE